MKPTLDAKAGNRSPESEGKEAQGLEREVWGRQRDGCSCQGTRKKMGNIPGVAL